MDAVLSIKGSKGTADRVKTQPTTHLKRKIYESICAFSPARTLPPIDSRNAWKHRLPRKNRRRRTLGVLFQGSISNMVTLCYGLPKINSFSCSRFLSKSGTSTLISRMNDDVYAPSTGILYCSIPIIPDCKTVKL